MNANKPDASSVWWSACNNVNSFVFIQQPLILVRDEDDASIRQGVTSGARVLNINMQKNRSGGC